MGRPKRDGLLYFSFDTDFFYADKRIKRLHAKYGNDGLILYIYLLTEIYRNGYCISWGIEEEEDVSADLGLGEGFIKQVLEYLASRSLITMITLAGPVTTITSPGIQKRYQEAVKSLRRDIEVNPEIWLLKEEETASCIKLTQNPSKYGKNHSKSVENPSKYGKNHTKEIKGKEIKGNKREGNTTTIKESGCDSPIVSLMMKDGTLDIYQRTVDAWTQIYPAVDVEQEFRNMKGWLLSNPERRKSRWEMDRFINGWLSRSQNRAGMGKAAQKLKEDYEMIAEFVREEEKKDDS